jgi:hypothetical protein
MIEHLQIFQNLPIKIFLMTKKITINCNKFQMYLKADQNHDSTSDINVVDKKNEVLEKGRKSSNDFSIAYDILVQDLVKDYKKLMNFSNSKRKESSVLSKAKLWDKRIEIAEKSSKKLFFYIIIINAYFVVYLDLFS